MKYGLKVFIQHYKSKEHWYVKYLIWGIVIIVLSAILVHVFKELGCTPAQKIFGFFDDWAIILSASVMLLLAGAAVWTIMDNRYARQLDRKECLLNEIIEWAERILLYGSGETVREGWAQLSEEQRTEKSFAMRKGFGFMDIRDKGISIIYMSSYIDAVLKSRIESTMKLLQQHINIWTLAKDSKIKNWQAISKHKSRLDKSTRQVIENATDLMCKGV